MENELIKIEIKDGRQVVSARELYIGIGFDLSDGNFSRWIKKQLEDVDAVENEDYIVNVFKDVNPNGGKPITDYIITVDIAKEICMVIGVAPRCKDEVKQKSKQIRKYFIECEKQLKEVNQKPQLSPQEQLALQLFNGGIDAITAHKQLLELETKELTNTIEEQKPFVAIAKERIVKGECVSLTDVTKGLNLKKGQISVWAKNNGLLSKVGTEVNKKGEEYFKIYIDKKGFKCVGIKEKGIDLINNNLEDIKNSPCRMTKK